MPAVLARMTLALKIFEGKVVRVPLSTLEFLGPDYSAGNGRAAKNLYAITTEIQRLSAKMTPWAPAYIVPALMHDGRPIRGVHTDEGIAISASKAYHPDDLLHQSETIFGIVLENIVSTFFHEAWHTCSKKLPPDMYDQCAEVVKNAHFLGDPDYMDTAEERLARCFQHWAMCHWQGWQSVTDDPRHVTSPSSIFAGVYSGYFAQVVAGQQVA